MLPENDNVDYRRMEGWLDSQAMRERDSGGGPPHGGGDDLSHRVGVLESDVKEIKADLKGVVKDVAGIKERLAGIEGRLSNLPTTFQMLTWFLGVSLGLVGVVFTIARSVGTH